MKTALIIIDIQNEYSPKGNLPLENFNVVLNNINNMNTDEYDLVISVKHINNTGLFTGNWNIAYPDSYKVKYDHEIIKHTADSFEVPKLLQLLSAHNINTLDICGMMTQNCVTYTALTANLLGYKTNIISGSCTTVNSTVHNIAIRALSSKVNII